MSTSLPQQETVRAGRAQEPAWSQRRLLLAIIGVPVALALGYLGQRFYDRALTGLVVRTLIDAFAIGIDENSLRLAGTVCYVLAMVIFALTAPGMPQWVAATARRVTRQPRALRPDAHIIRPEGSEAPPAEVQPASRNVEQRLQWLLWAAALALAGLAMFRFARQGEDAAVRWLWLGGIILFVGGQTLWPYLARRRDPRAESSPSFRWQHIAVLGGILGGALWLRVNQLAVIPDDFHGDMASMGLQARELLASPAIAIFREGWANIPMLGFIPSAVGLRVFGDNLFGLNMSAVIGGMFSLLGLYVLVWRLCDSHRLAALATAVLAINIPHIHFSRLAAYMDPWPFLLFAMFFIVDGMRARRKASFAFAGVLLGWGLQMYYSGRVVLPILIVAFVYLLLVRRKWVTENWAGWLLLATGVVLTLGPSLIYFAGNREPLIERSRAVWLFFEPVMNHLMGKYGVTTPGEVLRVQTIRSLLMFNQTPDTSTQFGWQHPMFTALLSPLVVLGFGYSVRRIRHPGLGLNLIWLVAIMVNGSILTGDAPFWPRLVGILPAAALLAAVVIDRSWATLAQLLESVRASSLRVGIAVGVAAFLLIVGWRNWQDYSHTMRNNAHPEALIGRYLDSLPDNVAACGFVEPYQLTVREIAFLAAPRALFDAPADAPPGLWQQCPGPPLVWILTPDQLSHLPALQRQWPNGVVEEHKAWTGIPGFTSYLVMGDGNALSTEAQPTPVPEVLPSSAFLPDGSVFQPQQTHLGDTSGTLWPIIAGTVEVGEQGFDLQLGPISGHDAVIDYIELVSADGAVYRFEAEDADVVSGDEIAPVEAIDGHWWRQSYGAFSAGEGLVGSRHEQLPVLDLHAEVPPGVYDLIIGSFRGDPGNGAFGLGLKW